MTDANSERIWRGDAARSEGGWSGEAAGRAGGIRSGRLGGADRLAGLERGYRRLLAAYPPDHRAEHGEEMLGVLMDGAAAGQRRPGAGESANLIAGGLRIRLRRAAGCFGDPRWRDTLALTSVLAPLAALANNLARGLSVAAWFADGQAAPGWIAAFQAWQLAALVGWAVTVVLVWARRRRGAATAAALILAGQLAVPMIGLSGWRYGGAAAISPGDIFLGTVTVAALLRSDGPRRGFDLLGRRGTWLAVGGFVAWAAAASVLRLLVASLSALPGVGLAPRQLSVLAWLAVGVVVVPLCVRTPVGRRFLVLNAPAMAPFGVLFLLAALAVLTRVTPAAEQLAVAGWMAMSIVMAVAVAVLAVMGRPRDSAGPMPARPAAS